MELKELATIIEGEITSSLGSGDLATERALELDYYNSKPLGNEREGESQVVSSDVFDAVEGMMPQLLKIFTASDDAVQFEPEGMEDEEAAKQRTDLCNYVFYRQNNGFLLMYEWFKDALLQKNGVVKYWWGEKNEITEDTYHGLTEGEYLTLMKEEGIEVLAHTVSDDPVAAEQKQAMLEKLQATPQSQQMLASIQAAPLPQIHDIKFRQTKDASKICIEAIPPEEFGISAKHKCISIQDTPFCYHRTKKTISALREMGCPEEVLKATAEDGPDSKPEVLARNRFTDENNESEATDAMREVWVTECFIQVDYDGDGKAELRHIIMPSRTPWINEPASHINFAAITPIIMPHRWIGKSIAEIVMDVQFLNSTLWRQMLNNLYLTNNPRKAVLSTASGVVQANLDDLMNSRSGGIVREYAPNAVRDLETPFVAGASFPMLEYMQGVKENRTGVTRYNQGTDADSLNKTARGIGLIQNAAQQKIDLIARIFAETGVKDLFRGIAYLLSKYSSKKMAIRLRGKWVDIDPRQWKSQYDMTVNVGLGTGNKDAQLVHLAKVHEMQLALMQEGKGYMVTDQNVWNLSRKMAENMGFKNPDMFISDPAQVQKPPPQPNPEMLKIQQADQEAKGKIQSTEKIRLFDAQTEKEIEAIRLQGVQAKIQSDEKVRLFDAQMQKELEAIKAQGQAALKQMELEAQLEIERMRIASQERIAVFSKDESTDPTLEREKIATDFQAKLLHEQTELEKAKMSEDTKLKIAASKPAEAKPEKTDDKSAQITAALSDLQKSISESKTPRLHKIKKLDDGYEITTQPAPEVRTVKKVDDGYEMTQ